MTLPETVADEQSGRVASPSKRPLRWQRTKTQDVQYMARMATGYWILDRPFSPRPLRGHKEQEGVAEGEGADLPSGTGTIRAGTPRF